jgi:hypothetical protein
MSSLIDINQAINNLNPSAQVSATGIDDITWHVGTPTSKSDLEAEVSRLEAEWDAQEYARNRQAEYPDWGTQFNKIYDDGIDAWKTDMVDPIKAKYPKP